MKLALVTLLAFPLVAAASSLPQHRFVFDVPEKTGTIKKLQVDLNETKGKWLAQTKSLASDGKLEPAQLHCTKITTDEFKCRRDDGGGGFDLVLTPTPKLTVSYFCADDEGAEAKTIIKAPKEGPLVIEGKKAALSTKDAI